MKYFLSALMMVMAYLPMEAQCPEPGTTDNADPVISSMTFDTDCMPNQSSTFIKVEWIMNINTLNPPPTDTDILSCTAPTGSWGMEISLPGHIDDYGGVPYTMGDIADIVNGGDFDWTYDSGAHTLKGINNVDMVVDLTSGNTAPGGEISIPVEGNIDVVTECVSIFSNVNIIFLTSFQGGCPAAFADIDNNTQESSVGTMQGVLPVEFSKFRIANQDCQRVSLEWATESEINNAGFEIQRSVGSADRFERIGFVVGNNNSTDRNNYTYEDENVSLFASQEVYYRLKQIDHNGTFDYSDILNTRVECSRTLGIEIYPNPVINDLQFELDGDRSQVRVIQVINSLGQIVKSYQMNQLESDKLDLSDLSAGMYNVKFVGESSSSLAVKQMIKLGQE